MEPSSMRRTFPSNGTKRNQPLMFKIARFGADGWSSLKHLLRLPRLY